MLQNGVENHFPYGTLLVNLIGCFCMGCFAAYVLKHDLPDHIYFFITTGFLGGFTTLSAFSLETIMMLRTGHLHAAVLYVLASVVLGLLLAYMGYRWLE